MEGGGPVGTEQRAEHSTRCHSSPSLSQSRHPRHIRRHHLPDPTCLLGVWHSLEGICVLLQEGDSCRGTAREVLVDELHKLADEGGQVAGRLAVVLQRTGVLRALWPSCPDPQTQPPC